MTRFKIRFFCLFYKMDTPARNLHCTFFHQELARLCLLKEIKPSPDRKVIRLPTFDDLFPPSTTFSLKLVVD